MASYQQTENKLFKQCLYDWVQIIFSTQLSRFFWWEEFKSIFHDFLELNSKNPLFFGNIFKGDFIQNYPDSNYRMSNICSTGKCISWKQEIKPKQRELFKLLKFKIISKLTMLSCTLNILAKYLKSWFYYVYFQVYVILTSLHHSTSSSLYQCIVTTLIFVHLPRSWLIHSYID